MLLQFFGDGQVLPLILGATTEGDTELQEVCKNPRTSDGGMGRRKGSGVKSRRQRSGDYMAKDRQAHCANGREVLTTL